MKKTLLTLAFVATTASLMAQGTVTFANALSAWNSGTSAANYGPIPGQPDRLVYLDTMGVNANLLRGTNWAATIAFAPGTVANPAALTTYALNGAADGLSKFRVSTTSSPGTWSTGARTLPGVNPGETATLQIRVWDVALFPTWDAARLAPGAVTGASALFAYTVPAAGTVDATKYYMDNFRGFVVTGIPEPSSFALLGLGAAAMLIFRRRN